MEGERRDFEGRCWGGVVGKWSALERIDTAIECSAAGDRLRRHSRQLFFCGPIWQNKDQRLREAHHSANTRLGRRGAFASTAGQQRPAHTFERSEQRRPRRVRLQKKKKKQDEGDASGGPPGALRSNSQLKCGEWSAFGEKWACGSRGGA